IENKLYGEVRRFTGHTDGAIALSISPDGKTIASGAWQGGRDTLVRLWDVKTGKNGRSLTGHTGAVGAVAFLSTGRHLLSGGNDRVIRLWDVDKGKEVRQFTGHPGGLHHLAVSSDGKTMVSCCAGSTWLFVWDVDTGKRLRYLQGHTNAARGVAFL